MTRMVSLRQTAKELGIPPGQVYRLIKTGKLQALQLKQGGTYRISTEEIKRIKSSENFLNRLFNWCKKG